MLKSIFPPVLKKKFLYFTLYIPLLYTISLLTPHFLIPALITYTHLLFGLALSFYRIVRIEFRSIRQFYLGR